MRVGDGQTGRVVARAVDAETARETVESLVQTKLAGLQVRLRVGRGDVADD
jgi:hypothetical protein